MLTLQGHADRIADRCDFQKSLTVTAASAYAANDVIGSAFAIDDSTSRTGPMKEAHLSAILQDVVLHDPSEVSPAIDLFFFNQALTATITNKTTFTPSDADLQNCIGMVRIAAADWANAGTNGQIAASSNQRNLGLVVKPGNNASAIYCVAVSRGAPTFNVASLNIRFKFSHGL